MGYVLDATYDHSNGSFVIVLSTIRLSTYNPGDVVHTDATYKCMWNKYPVILMGFSDKNRKFHTTIMAVSSHETTKEFQFIFETWKKVNPSLDFKYLMADAAEASFLAAKSVWPKIMRLMCYAHVYMVSGF